MISLVSNNWKIDNVETVLFDKDGTIIDLHYFWGKMTELRALKVIDQYNMQKDCFDSLCLFLGYDTKTERMIPDGITALYSRVKIIQIFRDNLAEFGVKTTEDGLAQIFDCVSEEFYKDMVKYTKPIPETIKLIRELKTQGIKVGIVTSDSVESTNLTIENFGWNSLFDTVIGRESSPATKESGVPTKMALDNLCANCKTTVMIGDAPMDYISAKNAGIEKTILVASGQITSEELRKTSEYVLDNLDEIRCKPIR